MMYGSISSIFKSDFRKVGKRQSLVVTSNTSERMNSINDLYMEKDYIKFLAEYIYQIYSQYGSNSRDQVSIFFKLKMYFV